MWCARIFILFLFFISPISLAKNQIVYFEPKISELSGTIAILILPGAPNYLSIKNGDEAEIGAYLVLDKPVDVKLGHKVQMGNDEPENNIAVIQLVLKSDEDWKKMENGDHVHISGTLFHAVWAHHHTRVLLNAKNFKIISKEKMDRKKLSSYLMHVQDLL
jgi:hypothetical protein